MNCSSVAQWLYITYYMFQSFDILHDESLLAKLVWFYSRYTNNTPNWFRIHLDNNIVVLSFFLSDRRIREKIREGWWCQSVIWFFHGLLTRSKEQDKKKKTTTTTRGIWSAGLWFYVANFCNICLWTSSSLDLKHSTLWLFRE